MSNTRRSYRNTLLVTVAMGAMSGCGTGPVLRSEGITQDVLDTGANVVEYRLARAVVPVTLKRSGSEKDHDLVYAIEIGMPRVTGDPNRAYAIRYEGSAFAEDDLTVQVDNNSRLLKGIRLRTTEKTDEVIIKAAENLALRESAPSRPEAVTLLRVEVDPTNEADIENIKKAMCDLSDRKVVDFDIAPARSDPIMNPSAPDKTADPDCTVGFCYRAPKPYRISYTFEGGRRFEKEIALPNDGPVIAVPLTRTPFVETVTNVTFVDGTPNQVSIKKPSEALELVSVPVEVAKAILRVPAELIRLRFDISSEKKKLAEIEKERIEAERELRKTRQNRVLDSGPLAARRQIFMFGASGEWGPSLSQTQTPENNTQKSGQGRASKGLDPVGGAPGTD